MLVADRIIELLRREGAEHIVGFPENRLIDAAARAGVRPIITRSERVAVNIADGFARGPTASASSLRDAVRPRGRGGVRRGRAGLRRPQPHPAAFQASTPSTAQEEIRRSAQRVGIPPDHALRRDPSTPPSAGRRSSGGALNALRGPRNGPVLVATANDVLNGEAGDAELEHPGGATAAGALPTPTTWATTVAALLGAERPVILAGQGVLYAGATAELVAARRAHPAHPSPRRSTARARFPRPLRSRSARRAARGRPPSTASSPRPISCSAWARASRARSTSRRCRRRRCSGRSPNDRRDLAFRLRRRIRLCRRREARAVIRSGRARRRSPRAHGETAAEERDRDGPPAGFMERVAAAFDRGRGAATARIASSGS